MGTHWSLCWLHSVSTHLSDERNGDRLNKWCYACATEGWENVFRTYCLYHWLQVFESILWKKWTPAIFYDFKHGSVEERVHQGDGIKCGQSLKRKMLDFTRPYKQEQFSNRKIYHHWQVSGFFFNLNRAGNVKTLLHARDVQLDHSQVFAFDYNASHRPHKSEREVKKT